MNPEQRDDAASRDPVVRGSLTRALASESRNALARVELAASELSRSGLAPALAGRVSTIREAVEEIDGLLGKIDLLSDDVHVPDRGAIDLASAARAVLDRVASGLGARGLDLEWVEPEGLGDRFAVCTPGPTVELLCLGLIRLLAGAVSPQAAGGVLDSASQSIRVEAVRRGDDVCLIARCAGAKPSARFDRTARLELEVVLAEWRGAFLVGDDPLRIEVGFALPAATAEERTNRSAEQVTT